MDKSARIALGLLAAAVGIFAVRAGISLAQHPSDETLIHQALADALDASKKGQSGGVMDFLSKQLKLNDQTVGESSTIVKVIRESHPTISVANQKVLVTGDEARMVSPVDLKAEFLGQNFDRHFDGVTLVFRKEEARTFLFIPTDKWRLSEVQLPQNQVLNVSE